MQLFREVRNKYTQAVRKAKASFFKQKFASFSTNSKKFWDTVNPHNFSFTQIQIAGVLKELQNLDPYKSAGLDNLDPLFLKLSAEIVATPITSLFNLSFISSEIPKDWKAAASSVCQIVVRTSGSLYGGATVFNSWADSLLCIHQ
ncbi:unnamed protein product [Oncorhynchus mykiss]|uniref:Reverse transcriptase domain-containing protein n=1 Tax=Oncorhynchus mykiss TaxID=8022 RepID=A0A060W1D9_ONCMY|nr:unnamed protein product [Oncorhynchus mykiss]